ncbi:MAG: DsbA family protein [Acidimicrobiales bacterium]
MKAAEFSVTWDYRCPFARNANEHILTALQGGAEWDVTFIPFCLDQAHVDEGEKDVWDDESMTQNLLAGQVGIVVRDRVPEQFPKVHLSIFRARHDESLDLRDEDVLRSTLAACGVDPNMVFANIEDGWPLEVYRKEHEAAVDNHSVFGVPTFIVGDQAAFVRLMTRPEGDSDTARAVIENVLGTMALHPELNEFKHTSIDF